MKNDNLTICPHCGGDACYENKITDEVTTWHCFGCGFCSNTLMKEGEEFFDEQTRMLPELYKDLLFKDEKGLTWMPSSVNKPKQGMVFVDGTNKDNWEWVGVKAVEIQEKEKQQFKIHFLFLVF